MGKVNSIFNISGGLGDYVFYTLNGKQVVRRKAAKKQGPKSVAQKKVKVLNEEFGRVSSAVKLFREALSAEVLALSNPGLHGALMKVLLGVKNEDPAEKGGRTVVGGLATEKGQALFQAFRFPKGGKAQLRMLGAAREGSRVRLQGLGLVPGPVTVIELQLNFETGKFRRAEHILAGNMSGRVAEVTRNLRSRKGYGEFWVAVG